MSQREAFEAWWDATFYGVPMAYTEETVAWQAWQAALASQWQPIETAPKGVDILVSRDFGKPPIVAGYFEETKEWLAFDDPFTSLHGLRFWMPLPPEPTT